jgi:hypothetical protein
MKERVCQFGPERNLIGILCEPAEKDLRVELPVLIMLNAGLIHRIGPHRMSVELARSLAERGIRSLRFDKGDHGDSTESTGGQSEDERAFLDVESAMDFLEQKKLGQSFVLFGLCSGADDSFAVALRDSRVVGTVQLDGHGFWTLRSQIVHYLPRVLQAQSLSNFFRRSLTQSFRSNGADSLALQWSLRRPFGDKREVERGLQSLVDRGTEMLYFYTGGVQYCYNYAGQYFDMFKGLDPKGRIKVVYYPNVDHTYSFAEDRGRMITALAEWYISRPWVEAQTNIPAPDRKNAFCVSTTPQNPGPPIF